MEALSDAQSRCAERLISLSHPTELHRPSALLVGPSGAGKRTVARAAAQSLGFEFLEVRLDGPKEEVEVQLFGNRQNARPGGTGGEWRGDVALSGLTLLYMTGLEAIDDSLLSQVHRLITRRTYVDGDGYEWRLSEEMWLVGALTSPSQRSRLHRDHWLCASFRLQVQIEPPSSPGDLTMISRNLCQRYQMILAEDAIPAIQGLLGAGGNNLHSLRTWIERAAVSAAANEQITGQLLHDAILNDLDWMLRSTSFRGCELTSSVVRAWAEQFPEDLRPIALHLVAEISQQYFVDPRTFYSRVGDLVEGARIPEHTRVVFGHWQGLGESAPRLAHVIKNLGGWKVDPDLDLAHSGSWSRSGRTPDWIVLVDDFVGSGNAVSRLFEPGGVGRMLLGRYPNVQMRILIVTGFEAGFRRIQNAIREYNDRVRLIPGAILRDEDTCFAPSSRIIPDAAVRERLRRFCLEAAKDRMRNLRPNMRLGYDGGGALVVFYDSIPNNSLPVLWHNSDRWRALFPRTGAFRWNIP